MVKTAVMAFLMLLYTPLYGQSKDAMNLMLDTLGLSESDLGFRPAGYWTRYPDPLHIPYKLPAFDDLLAEPQRIYDFVSAMGLAVGDFLADEYLQSHSDGLLKVTFYCGVRNLSGQFRAYSASLWAEEEKDEPLLEAIRDIYTRTNTVFRYNAMGQASDFPLIEAELRQSVGKLHPALRTILARTVQHIMEAYRFAEIGRRNVDMKDAGRIWRLRHLGETQFDGLEYYPELEDCAASADLNSIYYAGYKLVSTAEQLADTLSALILQGQIDLSIQEMNINTPIGRIVVAGSGNDVHRYSDAVLVLDLGGDDTYYGSTGATPALHIPVSLAIDMDGNDRYINDDEFLPSQGAAILGAGVLFDLDGDDEYQSRRLSQGAAMLGIGILADMKGDDKYSMWTSGQGAAYFGAGLAIDAIGDDEYRIHGDGQGYGGLGGAGSLVNRSGNDFYYAEPSSAIVFRPDYHSKDGKLNYSYAQGCGVGRRGDITDGHSWAGGMGTLIDLDGDDRYESANWSLGCGYWYGMGFLYDKLGNDEYKSASWSQAAGGHFCIGALIDEEGDDQHSCWEERSTGLGFGHDYTVALFLNRKGNDTYRVKDDGLGYAINMSQVFFIDAEGDDTYITGGKGHNFGATNYDRHNPPTVESMYHLYSNQISLFGDLSGSDRYRTEDFETHLSTEHQRMRDGASVLNPTAATRDTLDLKRHYGLGIDFKTGTAADPEYFRLKLGGRNKSR